MLRLASLLGVLILTSFVTVAHATEPDIAPVGTHRGSDHKWGYANSRGEMVISPVFTYAWEFASNGLARVLVEKKTGYIDKTGKLVIPAIYDYAEDFAPNGLARVNQGSKFGYINSAGEVAIQFQFDHAESYESNGLAAATPTLGSGTGYIDEKGEFVIPPIYPFAAKFTKIGIARVSLKNGKRAFIDQTGARVIDEEFDDAGDFSANGYVWVKRQGKSIIIDREGNFVRDLLPEAHPVADQFFPPGLNGLAHARKGRLFGFLDRSKNWVIPPQYTWARSFNSVGLAPVEKDGKVFYINAKGDYVFEIN